jgi:cytochrome P450
MTETKKAEQSIPGLFQESPVESRRALRRAAASGVATVIDEASGALIVLRYRDVDRLLTDTRLRGVGLSFFDLMGIKDGPLRDWYGGIMFTNEGQPHHRMRNLVGKAFSPRSVETMRPVAAAIVAERLQRVRAADGGDLVKALADVPMHVMCKLLGVPDGDVPDFQAWVSALSPVFVFMTPDQIAAATAAITQLLTYTTALCERRESAPGDDLISALIEAEHEGDRLTRPETAAMIANLLVAGHDTTASQIACALLALLAQPGLMENVRGEPGLIGSIVSEIIRLEPIIEIAPRNLVAPVEIAGIERPAGTMVWPCTLTANIDPEVWRDPLVFDPRRFASPEAPKLLTFGRGPHACLGAWLARVTLEEVIRGVAALAPKLTEEPADIEWVRLLGTNPARLPVALN